MLASTAKGASRVVQAPKSENDFPSDLSNFRCVTAVARTMVDVMGNFAFQDAVASETVN